MFKVAQKFILLEILLALLLGVFPVSAQTHLSGEIGVDLGIYNFNNDIFDQEFAFKSDRIIGNEELAYKSDRRIGNEYLDLKLNGPLVNGYFGNYRAMMRLKATQITSEVDGGTTNDYISPEITTYNGTLELFPNRAFPLKIYTGKSEENSVRYEPGNRSETEIVSPGLAVVRRYQTINEETGAHVRWGLMEDLEVGLEVKRTTNELNRQYDFDENRNIWVDFMTISPGVAPFYNVEVVNTIPDHDVLIYVDFAFADTVKAGGTLDLIIEEGPRNIDFVPVGLNAYSQSLVMNSNMQWKIFFSDPPGSKDMDQQNDIVMATLKYGEDGPFKTDAYFEYNDGTEQVQDMVTNLQTFNNLATYKFSPNASLNSLTTYSSNLTDVGVISHQLANMFQQQTTAKWRRTRGLSTMLSHSYSKMSSDTGADVLKSTNNIFTGNMIYPTHWKKHEVGLRLMGNFLSDNFEYSSNMLSAELDNRLELRSGSFRWRPKHSIKATKGVSKNPDGGSDELDSKLALECEHPSFGPVGNLRIKGQYDWRRKINEKGSNTKNRYLVEVGVIKRFNSDYKLMVSTGLDQESYTLVAIDEGIEVPQREPELRKTLRVDFQGAIAEGLDLGANGMWIATNDSRITKYSASVRLIVPVIDLPVRSFLIKEYREMEGLPPQEVLQLETKLSYNFRNISLVISHRLTDETLITEHYVYSEFLGKISRNFDIF